MVKIKSQFVRFYMSLWNFLYEVQAMFHPFTTIGFCLLVAVIAVFIFGIGFLYGIFVLGTKSYDIAISILTGVIASVFVALFVECGHNYEFYRQRESRLADLFVIPVYFSRYESHLSGRPVKSSCANYIDVIDREFKWNSANGEKDIVKIVWSFVPQLVERREKLRGYVEGYLFPEESRIICNIDLAIKGLHNSIKTYFNPQKRELIEKYVSGVKLPDFLVEYYYRKAMGKIFDFPAVMNLDEEGICISEEIGHKELEEANSLKEKVGISISQDCIEIYKGLKLLDEMFGREPCVRIANKASEWM